MSEFIRTRTLWEETVEDLISVSEAARIKGINESSVRKAIRSNRLRGKKVGPVHLVSRRQVEAWELTGKRRELAP
jgi:excisionase family DNA binding protein